jgi:hypothetical protein
VSNKRICIIEGVYALAGRGVAVYGTLDSPSECRVIIGDEVTIQRPEHPSLRAEVIGVASGSFGTNHLDILLPIALDGEIQPGDELWASNQQH